MSDLFSPFKIKDITLRNRIGVSPMCQYSYVDGLSNTWQLQHLGSLAASGVGLIIGEATAVEARGRITPHDLGLWRDEQIEPLARVARFIQLQGAVPGIQLAHAGRKACVHRPWDDGKPLMENENSWWPVVGASPLPFDEGFQVPIELSTNEISDLEVNFVEAAKRALEAGFLWLEVHAAHGYLLNSFLSPLSNSRHDQYGGKFENRIRFLVETVRAVKAVWPERLPLTVRISGTEWTEGGWDIPQSVELARVLKMEGVDLIDCSSGGNIPHAKLPLGPGYQVPISEAVRGQAGIATAAVGLITEAGQAEEIIHSGRADIVLLGREFLRNPRWAINSARELGAPLPVAPQYERAY